MYTMENNESRGTESVDKHNSAMPVEALPINYEPDGASHTIHRRVTYVATLHIAGCEQCC